MKTPKKIRIERAADSLTEGLKLIRAGMQKLQECYLELGDLPRTQEVRDTRRRIDVLSGQVDNGTKGVLRALRKSEIIDKFDEQALDNTGNENI